ncbi:MAG: hypothetical protein M1608_02880, partial [Candidatus Omnitrophica bacterium]|nr:hypothetical protein [Candidatus Omnitrophota bacterium]
EAFRVKYPGGPVVEAGVPGDPDGGCLSLGINLLEYPGDKWAIPYGGNPIPHKYPGRDISKRKGLFPGVESVSGMATWPKGRLVALQCDEEGEFATLRMVPPGNKIRINAIVPPSGYIQVSVAVNDGEPVADRSFEDMDPIVGDNLAFPITWKGQAELNHGGKPLTLRFRLRQAKLFGIEFTD